MLLTYRLDEIGIDHGSATPSTKYISSIWAYRDGKWLNVLGHDSPARSNEEEAGLSAQVLVKEREIEELQKQNDWQKFADLLSDDLLAIDEDGFRTKKEFLDAIKGAKIRFTDYKMEDVKVIPRTTAQLWHTSRP